VNNSAKLTIRLEESFLVVPTLYIPEGRASRKAVVLWSRRGRFQCIIVHAH
jgi:hypothetical protein